VLRGTGFRSSPQVRSLRWQAAMGGPDVRLSLTADPVFMGNGHRVGVTGPGQQRTVTGRAPGSTQLAADRALFRAVSLPRRGWYLTGDSERHG